VPTEVETKKGQPGSKATFPNGLKDVHEMAAAAEALSTLNTDETMKVAERKGVSVRSSQGSIANAQLTACSTHVTVRLADRVDAANLNETVPTHSSHRHR